MWQKPDLAPRMGVPWEKELRRNSSGKKNQPVALLIDERFKKKGMRVIIGIQKSVLFSPNWELQTWESSVGSSIRARLGANQET